MTASQPRDSLRTKARRVILGAVKARLSGADRFGKRPLIDGKVFFHLDGPARFGDGFMADGTLSPVDIRTRHGGTVTIGNYVYMNSGVSIDAWHEVRIGDNVLMGPFASIIDSDRHELEPGAILDKGSVIIGNNVWLGRNVAVLPGVRIGDGSAIGANSVVTRDIPPNSFAAGVPAKVIRKLEIPDGWVRH
jgi:maltose O-acetyltransferase